MKVDIIPAVLPKSFDELSAALAHLRGVAKLVQVDLVGENVLSGRDAMPLWEEFDFEFDLMLAHPAAALQGLLQLGPSRVVVHLNHAEVPGVLQSLQASRQGDFAVAVGVALQAHDEPDLVKKYEGLYDFVQVMGIDHEGSQGQPPDPHHRELELIRALRAQNPALFIQVDGASAAHPGELARAGVSRLIAGSAVVHAENPKAVLKTLYTEANAQ